MQFSMLTHSYSDGDFPLYNRNTGTTFSCKTFNILFMISNKIFVIRKNVIIKAQKEWLVISEHGPVFRAPFPFYL